MADGILFDLTGLVDDEGYISYVLCHRDRTRSLNERLWVRKVKKGGADGGSVSYAVCIARKDIDPRLIPKYLNGRFSSVLSPEEFREERRK